MLLQAKELLARLESELQANRRTIERRPTLAAVWIKTETDADRASQIFLNKKRELAEHLDCQFQLIELMASTPQQQAEALLVKLSTDLDIDGVVLQLPIPERLNRQKLINLITPLKDIDGLKANSPWPAPNPKAVVSLLTANSIRLEEERVVILGNGILIGQPLSLMLKKLGISFFQIDSQAETRANEIRKATVLIAATGIRHLVSPSMVHKEMVVVDASGLDVEVEQIEPLVKSVTPKHGAVGPLTVHYLIENLILASRQASPS